MQLPKIGEPLNQEQVDFLKVFSKSCRRSIVEMVMNSQSGHPGGSCSVIDYLALLYCFIISQTGEDVVVSNGHVSPAVYTILGHMGYIPLADVVRDFRKKGSVYEGHITRHVAGVTYGTGPLGIGVSVASGFAISEKLKGSNKRVFGLVGDGESDEGEVYEMMHFANKYKLDNFTLFMDYNEVQLSGKLDDIMPIDPKKIWESANWNVIEVDGHDFAAMWNAIGKSYQSDRPTILIGHTVMGKGVSFMEPDGLARKSVWHGVAPKPEVAQAELDGPLKLTDEERDTTMEFRKLVKWQPPAPEHIENLSPIKGFNTGSPIIQPAGTKADCRGAYGKALLDLAKLNPGILAATADLGGSVKTDVMAKEFPKRVLEVGIAEQHMVSMAGGLSLHGHIPFASTFGAFLTSRAKDQARVNDINRTNVKMVATHCGLSVGEDGPTHQAIDDMGSMLGFFNTYVLEPSDANHTDYIIRYIASRYGNFYVRMGRHKFEVILKEDGTPFYDENFKFEYGKADLLREGSDVTVVAGGSMVSIAVQVADKLKGEKSVEVIAVSSLKDVDLNTLLPSLQKTGKLITIEDHNPYSGLASQVNSVVAQEGLSVIINNLAVRQYQLSGTSYELYDTAGIGADDLENACKNL
ncbi:transketolase [Patescibacteria group bacterium]|nr:transketolase [Patescibacteria group bacterium]MBU1016280.1 transketolase [Patescibacteria group bacterium]MBU1685526.1 transketolase [Patescibacteria group bacterium]MBU1938865.1 transketolase [Patescibacteria group bacterium]